MEHTDRSAWQQRTELLLGEEKWNVCAGHMCWLSDWEA